jgi:hypothetical protein
MSVNVGFKQPCPSCETLVPVKDDNLVGKKIDCPKCKYRFVVRDPKESSNDSDKTTIRKIPEKKVEVPKEKDKEKEKEKEDPAKAAKKPVTKAAAKKVRDDDEDDEEDRPRKKSTKSSAKDKQRKMMLGGGLAAAVSVLLAVAYSLMSGSDDGGRKNRDQKQHTTIIPLTDSGKAGDKDKPLIVPQPSGPELDDPSHHLLRESQLVINLAIPDVLRCFAQRFLFDAAGGIPPDFFERLLDLDGDSHEQADRSRQCAQGNESEAGERADSGPGIFPHGARLATPWQSLASRPESVGKRPSTVGGADARRPNVDPGGRAGDESVSRSARPATPLWIASSSCLRYRRSFRNYNASPTRNGR